jgi:Fuc2NAc and GlcNAc transferase
MLNLFLCLLLASIVHVLLCKLFIHLSSRYKVFVDIPNQRSSHNLPTPRGLGIVFGSIWSACSFLLCFFYAETMDTAPLVIFIICALSVLAIGMIDDNRPLSAKLRLFLYVMLSAWFINQFPPLMFFQLGNVVFNLGVLNYFVYVFLFVWSINLFNFMDGTDGLALFHGFILFSSGGVFLYGSGVVILSLMCLLLAWLLLLSLMFNFPPHSKAFIGDSGSTFLGFIVAGVALIGQASYAFPAYLWIMLHGTFLFDATLILVRRMFNDKYSVLVPHKQHLYQRLLSSGRSKLEVLRGFVLMDLLVVFITFLAWKYPDISTKLLMIEVFILSVAYVFIERIKPMSYMK